MNRAFHAFDAQSNASQLSYGITAQALSVIEPKDRAIALEAWFKHARGEGSGDFMDENLPVPFRSYTGGWRFDRIHLVERYRILAAAVLSTITTSKVIVNHIACHYFQKAEQRVFMSAVELAQGPEIICA